MLSSLSLAGQMLFGGVAWGGGGGGESSHVYRWHRREVSFQQLRNLSVYGTSQTVDSLD